MGVAQGFASGANTSVACSSDNSLEFKNVGALIAFRFESPADAAQTASVTFKAKTSVEGQYYGLTGSSTVALQEGLPVASEGSADYVTVVAPEGGFECGSNKVYYAVVYPGAINGFGGLADAWFDSFPVLAICGNVPTNEMKGFSGIRQTGFQEMNIVSMTRHITKYSVTANTPENFAEIVNRAFNMSNLGRKGGVLIDFPLNIQQADIITR